METPRETWPTPPSPAFGRIDALVHVMGGFAGGKSVAETDDATFDKMLDLNCRAAFFMARAVLPHMRRQGGGRVLAVASRQAVGARGHDGRVQRLEGGPRGAHPRHRAREQGPLASRRTPCCRAP